MQIAARKKAISPFWMVLPFFGIMPKISVAPETEAPATEAETEAPAKKGCGSVVGAGAAVMAIITFGALVIGKKKD